MSAELKQTAFSFYTETKMSSSDYMVSACNQEAFSYVNSWPDWPESGLVIYGPKGCGKTHLAHLFAEKVNEGRIKTLQIPLYESKQIKMNNIEKICNSSDVIIIENLEKNVDQEALFHLFNSFNKKGKYMLWTSDVAPARLNLSLQDLQSRLEMLTAIEIKEPDDIMLRALIVKLFNDRQIMISPEILEYIITNTERSFSYVENLVKEIDEISLAYKSTVNYKIVKEALENLYNAELKEPDLFNL